MKTLALSLIVFSTLVSLSARADSHPCADYIQQSVIAQAKADFPGQTLNPIMPTVYEDGGSVENYQIPMVSPKNPLKTVVTYDIEVDEVCDVIHLYQL